MRFIQAIVDGQCRYRGFGFDPSYRNLLSYKYMGDKMSLLEFNNYIKSDNTKSLKENLLGKNGGNYLSLPLLNHSDMETMRSYGYAFISRISGEIDYTYALFFDLEHKNNQYLKSLLRDERLSEIIR